LKIRNKFIFFYFFLKKRFLTSQLDEKKEKEKEKEKKIKLK